ncbi:MAG: MerR family transcriptional regulator [Thermodesulfovibrionales bacterium]|nr:MerR family transcriptional regulator [Thermodesulfovibrionales bacterium]
MFYKIGEVSKMLEVETYVIRYWESEFPFIKPKRSSSGQRLYTKEDVNILSEIKKLLYYEKYTIEGVRKKFKSKFVSSKELSKEEPNFFKVIINDNEQDSKREIIEYIKNRLQEVLKML